MSLPDLPKQVSLPDLEAAAAGLDDCIRALASGFPELRVVDHAHLEVRRAVRLNLGSRWVVPHAAQDDLLLSLMKLVRIATANNAALALISAGYAQEAHPLWHMIDLAYAEIVAMAGPLALDPAQGDDRSRIIDRSLQPRTPDPGQAIQRQANDLFRSLLAVALVARGANRVDVVERVCDLAAELARTTGCLDGRPP